VQRSRKVLACSLVLFGLALKCATEVRAQPAPPAPAQPPPPVAADAGAPPPTATTTPPPEPPTEVAPAPDAGAPETAPASPEAPVAPATEEAPSTGSGLFESSQSGAAAPTDGAPVAAAEPPAVQLGGYVRGDLWVGKTSESSQPELKAAYGELSLKLTTRKEEYGDGYADVRVRYGLQDIEQRVFLDLREAYVNAYLGPLDIRVGQQIIVWGRADAFNPTNNISPLDLRVRSPVEDDRRIGNVGLRTFLNFEPMRLEGVWMPLYVPAELPRDVVPDFVRFDPPRFPSPGLSESLGAVRLHLELPAFETSVSYLYGYAPLPGFVLTSFTGGENTAYVGASRTPYQHQVIGFDFSTAFGDAFALRGEAAYRRPKDWEDVYYRPRPDLQYVLGVDRTFGTVNVIAQYMGRYVFDWEREEPAQELSFDELTDFGDPISNVNQPIVRARLEEQFAKTNQILFAQRAEVQHMATLRVEWLLAHDTLSLSALGMVNVTTEEWLLFPKVAYKLSDALSATVGGEVFMGPDETLFGLVDEGLSAGYAEVKYAF
jgi:hypothetical protein